MDTPTTPNTPPVAPKSSSKMGPILGVIGVLVAAGIIGEVAMNRNTDKDGDEATPTTTDTTPTPVASNYKDGTYTAEGDYATHVGPEAINITVTLKDNVITDTQFQGTPNAPMSQRFMDMFSQNYKTLVVGKNINEVHLGKVSGSSLTPKGFNDALEKIKAQAKA